MRQTRSPSQHRNRNSVNKRNAPLGLMVRLLGFGTVSGDVSNEDIVVVCAEK